MAESDKGAAPANKAKENSSLLDDDISKDFLGSWGTMFNSNDSSSGFNLEPISKGRKKDFDFDKMDFNLDGEFEKINSFTVDMGDLDFPSPSKASTKSKETDLEFSSPPKNAAKSTEKKEGDSAKRNKGKQDCFAFSFDFSELDKFDIDTELTEAKKPSKFVGNQGVKITSIDEADHNGSKIRSIDVKADAGIGFGFDKFDIDTELTKAKKPSKVEGNQGVRITSIDEADHNASKIQSIGVKADAGVGFRLDKFDMDTELTKAKKPSKVEGNQGVKITSIDEADHNGSKIQSIGVKADAGIGFGFDKFDIDTELTKAKKPSKVEGNQGVKIASIDEADHDGSKIQSSYVKADAEVEGVAKVKSSLVKENKLKESVSAHKGVLDFPPGGSPSETYVPVKDQLEPKQCRLSSVTEDANQMSIPEEKIHKQSGEVPKLQNQSAETPKDQIESKLDVVSSERETIDRAQEQQSHNVEKTCIKSYEELQTQDQSFTDKKNTLNALETMHVRSPYEKSGNEDSGEQALNALETALTMEDENLLLGKMRPPHEGLHMKNPSFGVSESESNHTEKNKRQSCHISRFNLKQLIKDKTPAAAQALPARANVVSLSRSTISSSHPSSSGARERSNPMEALMKKRVDVKPVPIDGKTAEKGIAFQGSDKKKLDSKYFSTFRSSFGSEHSNSMEAPMKKQLDAIPVVKDGKTADKGTAFQGDDKKKQDGRFSRPNPMEAEMTKQLDVTLVPKDGKTTEKGAALHENVKKLDSNYSRVQASSLPDLTSKTHSIANEDHKPKIPSMQSVRKLKMDTIVCKLTALNVSKKISDRSSLKSSNSTPLEDKRVMTRSLGANASNLTTKAAQLVGLGKLQSPSPSIKRKTAEASDAAPAISPPPKRLSTNQSRNSYGDPEGSAQERATHQTSLKVGLHKKIVDSSLEKNSDKQPQPTPEVTPEMRFAEAEVSMLIEDGGNIQKSEAYGRELDQICSILRKKQDEAKDLLIRALITNNSLLLLGNPTHDKKLCQVQKFASRLMSKELPSRSIGAALQ